MPVIQLAPPFRSFRGRSSAHDGQVIYPYFARNVARAHVIPANNDLANRTPYQAAMRTLFADLSRAYGQVTDAENEGWKTLAPQLEYDDKDGNRVHVPSKSAFVSINFWRNLAGQPIAATAPTYTPLPGALTLSNLRRSSSFGVPPSGGNPQSPISNRQSAIVNRQSSGWHLDYSWTGPPAFLALKNTPPLPGQRRQPKPCDYRFSTDDPTNSIFPITNAGGTLSISDSDSRFPIAPGKRIAFQAQILNPNYIPSQTVAFQAICS